MDDFVMIYYLVIELTTILTTVYYLVTKLATILTRMTKNVDENFRKIILWMKFFKRLKV